MSARHGKDPNRVTVFRGCGAGLLDADGNLVGCDRSKWHRGDCSTIAMRRAARQETDR